MGMVFLFRRDAGQERVRRGGGWGLVCADAGHGQPHDQLIRNHMRSVGLMTFGRSISLASVP